MSKKLEIEDIKPGLIIINDDISSNYQYMERIDEIVNNTVLIITSCCRNRSPIINNEVDWYSMGTFYQTLDESIYNSRRARINEIWYFNLNIIEEKGRGISL